METKRKEFVNRVHLMFKLYLRAHSTGKLFHYNAKQSMRFISSILNFIQPCNVGTISREIIALIRLFPLSNFSKSVHNCLRFSFRTSYVFEKKYIDMHTLSKITSTNWSSSLL